MGLLKVRELDNDTGMSLGGDAVYNELRYAGAQFSAGSMTNFRLGTGNNHVFFDSPPALVNDIIAPGVTVNHADWATISPTGEVVPLTNYETSPNSLIWSPRSNIALYSDLSMSADATSNTMRLAPAAVPRVAGLSNGARLSTNALLVNGCDFTIAGDGSFTATNVQDAIVEVCDDNNLTMTKINVPVIDCPAGAVSLVKGGNGTLELGAANTYTGDTIVAGGTLRLAIPQSLRHGTLRMGAGASLVLTSGLNEFGMVDSACDDASIGLGPATLSLTGGSSGTFAGSISGPGSLLLFGSLIMFVMYAVSYFLFVRLEIVKP